MAEHYQEADVADIEVNINIAQVEEDNEFNINVAAHVEAEDNVFNINDEHFEENFNLPNESSSSYSITISTSEKSFSVSDSSTSEVEEDDEESDEVVTASPGSLMPELIDEDELSTPTPSEVAEIDDRPMLVDLFISIFHLLCFLATWLRNRVDEIQELDLLEEADVSDEQHSAYYTPDQSVDSATDEEFLARLEDADIIEENPFVIEQMMLLVVTWQALHISDDVEEQDENVDEGGEKSVDDA